MNERVHRTDVLVVGAGPTGLMLAGELGQAAVATTLVERRAEESNLTRAFVLQARTLELLDARGLADPLIATGQKVESLQLLGHTLFNLSSLSSRFPFVLVTPQYQTERVLRDRAIAAGVTMLQGSEAVALRQDADGAEVDLRLQDGTIETWRARYIVGADGVHSMVRREVGLPFPGHASAIDWLALADVRLTQAPGTALTANATDEDFALVAPFGDGWYRVFAWSRHARPREDEPIELDWIRAVARRAFGTDFGMHDARWISRFHNDERQVPRYRVGRVFVAGDAAHVHSPAGGQGMNTGLQDAANLGWKLAAVLRGRSPAALLDTYDAERRPVGHAVVAMTGVLARFVSAQSPALRALRVLLGATVFGVPPLKRAAIGAVTGIGIRYTAEADDHRLVGRRAIDVALTGVAPKGSRLYEALRSERFVLVTPPRDRGWATSAAASWASRVDVVHPAAGDRERILLVRPDGYIAWTTDARGAERREELGAALHRWCGPPGDAAVERRTNGLRSSAS